MPDAIPAGWGFAPGASVDLDTPAVPVVHRARRIFPVRAQLPQDSLIAAIVDYLRTRGDAVEGATPTDLQRMFRVSRATAYRALARLREQRHAPASATNVTPLRHPRELAEFAARERLSPAEVEALNRQAGRAHG